MSASPSYAVFVQPPRSPGYRLDLGSATVTIGRSSTAQIQFDDPSLSRRHAEFITQEGPLRVRDLGSRNGTFVNGRPVSLEGTTIDVGDVVSIGETLITIEAKGRPAEDLAVPESAGTLILKMDELLDRDRASVGPAEEGSSSLARFGRQMAMFEALNEATVLRSDRPIEELLDDILAQIFELVPAERGVIMLMDSGGSPVPRATRFRDPSAEPEDIQISRAITQMALRDRAAITTLDAQSDPRFAERASIKMSGIRSAVCAPLFTGRSVLGLLYVDTTVAERTFDWDDLTLVSTLAVITAMKVENHGLVRAFLEKEKLERELEIAKEIAETLLPTALPDFAGYELYAKNIPCHAIGGDYYDFHRDGATLHVLIADVCGKGIPAALLMAALQATFRAHLASANRPAALMKVLNDSLVRSTPISKYATVFYGRLVEQEFTYVNAGHNPPLLFRGGSAPEKLQVGGMVCGMFQGAEYEEGTVSLGDGDLLTLFTDGLPDEESPQGEQVETPRLIDWFQEFRTLPLEELGTRVFERLDGWCAEGDRFDDRTLVMVRGVA